MATPAAPDRLTQAKPARSHLPFILGIAILARVAFAAAYCHANPPNPLRILRDEDVAIAIAIQAGQGFASPFSFPSGPTAVLAPGYPWLIAGFVHLMGTGVLASKTIIAFQLLLSVLTVGIVMGVARQHFGIRAANFAGLICAIAEPLLLAPMYIWDTTISALILVTAIFMSPFVRNRAHLAACGAGCALATLINPSLLPSLLVIFAWSARRVKIFPWIGIMVFTIVFSPWPMRNFVRMHAFIPLRSNAGYELWLGNHPGADGESPKFVGPTFNRDARHLYLSEGEVVYMAQKYALARTWINTHPKEFARLTALRFLRFWAGSSKSPAPLTIPLALAGMAGLVLLWRSKSLFALFAIPLAIYPLPYYITHADARYQFVIDPLLAVLAGYACECLLALIDRRPLPAPVISPRQTPDQPSA